MQRIKISAVSYLNSLPFVYGLTHSTLINECDISLDIPSVCAEKLINGTVDIGLIPVAAIPQVPNATIISDYCIGANGEVKTVCLFSEVPLNEIKTILLDYQSRTSVLLVKILAKEFWKINPEFINAEAGFEQKIKGTTAGVVIGDRTFELIPQFKNSFDLAYEWKKFTGLPFVFAAWVSNRPVRGKFIISFNLALKRGLISIDRTLDKYPPGFINRAQAIIYLKQNISYDLDAQKKKAMKLFLQLAEKIHP